MTTLPGMTQTNYGNMYIPLPSIDMQTLIVEYIEKQCAELDALISANHKTIEKLKEYRQSVIYEAVTGKVEI
jgi:restriction endonuclease S subunit